MAPSRSSKLWLNGFHDVSANLTSCYDLVHLALGDLSNDDEYLLAVMSVCEDVTSKITVFRGPYIVTEIDLLHLAVGLCVLSLDSSYPALVVAAESSIFVYKNMKPFYKFSVPELSNPESRITCFSSVYRYSPDVSKNSLLVIGTEEDVIYVVDPQAFTVISTIELPATPSIIRIIGYYDVECSFVVATRDSAVYIVYPKQDQIQAIKMLLQNSEPIFELLAHDNSVIIVSAYQSTCYSLQGCQLWNWRSDYRITAVANVTDNNGDNLIMAATTGGFVNLLMKGKIISNLVFSDEITAMTFGRFGREDAALILVTKSGELIVKILNRAFDMESLSKAEKLKETAESKKIEFLPQRTKLFVEHSFQEQENPAAMYEAFQHGLTRIKLRALQQLTSAVPTSAHAETCQSTSINATSTLLRNGNFCQLRIKIHNSGKQVQRDLYLALLGNAANFRIEIPARKLGFLFPASFTTEEFKIKVLNGQGGSLELFVSDKCKLNVLFRGNVTIKPISL